MIKSKYFVKGNKPINSIDNDAIFTNNFYKTELHIYMKAVVEFNRRCGMPVLLIYENAYNIHGRKLDNHYALHYANLNWSSDLSYFWRLYDLYKYKYESKKSTFGTGLFDGIQYNAYVEAKKFFKEYNTYDIQIRDIGIYFGILNHDTINITIKKRK